VVIEQNSNQSGAKTSGVHIPNVTAVPEGTYEEKVEIAHGRTITPRIRNDTVNASGERQRNVNKLDSSSDKP